MTHFHKNKISLGFTLVEIAVVLVIFSLVVTGVLRGQELINSAKARNIIDQKSGIQAAFIAFSNRYKAMAGDLTTAQASFIGSNVVPSTTTYAGNGVIDYVSGGTPTGESALVFQNLTATSLLSCANCLSVTTSSALPPLNNANTVVNIYNQYLQFSTSAASTAGVYWLDINAANLPARNILTTGSKVTAAILQQVDIKADDASPGTGLFRQSTSSTSDTTAACTTSTGSGTSTVYAWSSIDANCAGAWLF